MAIFIGWLLVMVLLGCGGAVEEGPGPAVDTGVVDAQLDAAADVAPETTPETPDDALEDGVAKLPTKNNLGACYRDDYMDMKGYCAAEYTWGIFCTGSAVPLHKSMDQGRCVKALKTEPGVERWCCKEPL